MVILCKPPAQGVTCELYMVINLLLYSIVILCKQPAPFN